MNWNLSDSGIFQDFTWEIPNFFMLSSEVGYSLQSDEFRFDGDKYSLRLYPGGNDDSDSEKCVDIVLVRLASSAPEKRISYEIWCKSRTEEECRLIRNERCFESVGGIGFYELRSKVEEERESYAPGGVLTVYCRIRVSKWSVLPLKREEEQQLLPDHVSRPTTLNSVHLRGLSRDFSSLLKDETFSDVKLICGGRTFCANRTVLAARSEVFAAMFRNKMAEAEAGVVNIKDTDPDVLEMFLKYVYSAEMPDLRRVTAHHLYEAADKYAVHDLRRACSDWMVKWHTPENCLDLLVLGDKHSDENFKEAVEFLVAEHLADLSFESWATFKNNYPLLAISVLEKRCKDSIPGSAKRARLGP